MSAVPGAMPEGITILVDADACPVKDEVYRVAARYGLSVVVVANSFLNVPREPWIERVVVSDRLDAADDWIAERAGPGTIVVTADVPLASRCVKAGASVLAPTGKPFTDASVGMALATLQRLDPIYADFPVPEEALATLATDEAVAMRVDAIPGRTFEGKIKAIDARVSADSRNVTARAEFANSDRRLLPGMFANLTVTTGAPAEVLTVPRTAIVYSLYGDNVFVVKPAPPTPAMAASQSGAGANAAAAPASGGLIAERRFVRVGQARGERIAIEDGLKPGEQVVVSGQIKLQANSPIVIERGEGLPPPPTTPKP